MALTMLSCAKEEFEFIDRFEPQINVSNTISPVVRSDAPADERDLPPYATKSLIDALTTRHLSTQFLRVDENVGINNDPQNTFPTWANGYLTEASVISSPGNQTDSYMRSILMNPVQSYRIYVPPTNEGEVADTVFYNTRMMSWYPITCPLHKENGVAALTKFNHYTSENVGYDAYTVDPNGDISINFRGLNGETDVMVSEVRDGQYWHNPSTDTPDRYRQPFGRNDVNPAYDNCFKYKHYLSAVKVYAYADNSSQDAAMWGHISKVIVRNQPSTCSVTIPNVSVPNINNGVITENRTYGQATFHDTDLVSFPLIKTPIFGNDTNADNMETAPDNPTLDGTSASNRLYLGYALIAPERDVVLDIHTESGIYSVKVSNIQSSIDESGVTTETKVFEPGFIYNIVLNFSTDGTIASILLKDAHGIYYDLTTGDLFGDNKQVYLYKIANSYIVDPTLQYQDKQGNSQYYDGYAFLANTIGNGSMGLFPDFPQKTAKITPSSAGLIWESKEGLITQVEFMYDYVRFKVQPPKTPGGAFDKGNGVIGVYDDAGKLLWSWHIWITDKPEEYTIKVGQKDIGIMDRNLGATCINDANDVGCYGLYYQWGRKDPSMPPPEPNYRPLSTATTPYYDYYGNRHESAEIATRDKPTIQDGIDNPMYLVLPTSIPPYYAYDWLYHRVNTLWGRQDSNQKSIYDPCPFGYRVPGEELRTFLSANTKTLEGNAYAYPAKNAQSQDVNIYFPLAGYKGVDRGISSLSAAWKYPGEKGDYMTKDLDINGHRNRAYLSRVKSWTETGAADGIDGHGSRQHNYTDYVTLDFANRRTAASVRCVSDTFLDDMGKIYTTLNAPNLIMLGETAWLEWEIKAVGAPLENIILTSQFNNNDPKELFNQRPQDIYTYKDRYRLSGSKPNKYSDIGTYTYTLKTKNQMGIIAEATKTIPVINITELYDVKFNASSTGSADYKPHTSDFAKGLVLKDLNLKINMRELGEAGRQATTVEDLKLLISNTDILINGKYIDSKDVTINDVDKSINIKTPTAITSQILLIGDITITFKERGDKGRELRKYVMRSSIRYYLGEQIKDITDSKGNVTTYANAILMNDGTYFTASLRDNTKYWWHTGSDNNTRGVDSPKELKVKDLSVLETLEDGTKIIDPHHVFQYVNHKNFENRIKIVYNDKWLGDFFGAVDAAYNYAFDPGIDGQDKYYKDGVYFGGFGEGIISTIYYPIKVKDINGDSSLNWMYRSTGGTITGKYYQGTLWNVYKVNNMITYTAPNVVTP